MTPAEIFHEASRAAGEAAGTMIAANPEQFYPCGFAWVNIKPARGKFVAFLKEHHIGRTDDYYGGYTIWNPSNNPTQWMDAKMDAKMDGARAFAEVLNRHGIKTTANQRID